VVGFVPTAKLCETEYALLFHGGDAEANEDWFRGFLDLPNGIPSHDTFGNVLTALAPEAFERVLRTWFAALAGNATENLARLHRVGLGLLKNEKNGNLGIKTQRRKAGYQRGYLLKVLGFKGQT
jgi:hypothetical protein